MIPHGTDTNRPTDDTAADQLPPLLIDVAKAAGVTYRQADYWARRGHIHPIPYHRPPHATQPAEDTGSGRLRRLPPLEAEILHTMARLVNGEAHLSPAIAAILARSYVEDSTRPLTLAPGIQILINPEHPQDQP